MQQLGRSCANYLLNKSSEDDSLWVIDGDLADSNGAEVFAINNNRFIQAGIAEQNMISMAAGLATTGKMPWVFSFSAFLCYRAYDQIRVCVSQTRLPVVLVGSHAGACTGRNGKTHASLNDICLMSTLPHMEIWTPADAEDIKFSVNTILEKKSPSYIRCPRDPVPLIFGKSTDIRWLKKGSSVAIISYGLSTHWAIKIQEELLKNNIEVSILHFCKLWPINKKDLEDKLQDIKIAFVLEDHYPIGGLFSLLLHFQFSCKLVSLAWPINWHSQSGLTEDLLNFYGLDTFSIVGKIMKTLEK